MTPSIEYAHSPVKPYLQHILILNGLLNLYTFYVPPAQTWFPQKRVRDSEGKSKAVDPKNQVRIPRLLVSRHFSQDVHLTHFSMYLHKSDIKHDRRCIRDCCCQ